jgi:hypothetical protein
MEFCSLGAHQVCFFPYFNNELHISLHSTSWVIGATEPMQDFLSDRAQPLDHDHCEERSSVLMHADVGISGLDVFKGIQS